MRSSSEAPDPSATQEAGLIISSTFSRERFRRADGNYSWTIRSLKDQ